MRPGFGLTLFAASSTILCGCAPIVTAFKNDPLQHYDVRGPTIYAMTGDRRTAVLLNKDTDMHFCAESLPDAVAAYSAASKANAGIEGRGSAGFEDATYAGLLQTFQRTEIAEVYRQMGWNLCLAWAQGAISRDEYHDLLGKFVTGGLDAISKRAAQQQTWPTVAPGSLFIGPGAAAAAPQAADKPPQQGGGRAATAEQPPSAVDLGSGVSLQAASTPSGYCIKAAAGYTGTGAINKPKVSDALPLCAAPS